MDNRVPRGAGHHRRCVQPFGQPYRCEELTLPAPKGNQFWRMRSSHGRNPIFATPEALWDAAEQYFEWVEDNPLYEDKISSYQGEVTHEPVAKMRAMTIGGLCIFLDISQDAWREYGRRKDFIGVVTRAEEVIRTQKFAGAAADLLNANIIARDLGLADKQEHTGKDGGPIKTETNLSALPTEDLKQLQKILAKAKVSTDSE